MVTVKTDQNIAYDTIKVSLRSANNYENQELQVID
jgi:hypothetical protein